MRRWRLPTGTAAAALALVLLIGGCSTDSPSSGDGTPGIGPDAPLVGQCRVLTAADVGLATNATPTVPCHTPHTALTIHVGAFPADRITSRNLTSGALGDAALQQCTTAWRRTVGGTPAEQRTTVAGLAYFLPDPDELGAGARWFRCDVVLGGRDGMELQDLPAAVTGLLDDGLPDSLRACRTTPEFADGRLVPCSRPHVLRAIGIAPLRDSVAYPGAAALDEASGQLCQDAVRRWLHGRIGAGTAYQWPDETSWTVLHDRSAVCWAVTAD